MNQLRARLDECQSSKEGMGPHWQKQEGDEPLGAVGWLSHSPNHILGPGYTHGMAGNGEGILALAV